MKYLNLVWVAVALFNLFIACTEMGASSAPPEILTTPAPKPASLFGRLVGNYAVTEVDGTLESGRVIRLFEDGENMGFLVEQNNPDLFPIEVVSTPIAQTLLTEESGVVHQDYKLSEMVKTTVEYQLDVNRLKINSFICTEESCLIQDIFAEKL